MNAISDHLSTFSSIVVFTIYSSRYPKHTYHRHMWTLSVLLGSEDDNCIADSVRRCTRYPEKEKTVHIHVVVDRTAIQRFNSVVPLRPCSTRPHCRSTSKHSLPICQAQAASVAEQSAPTSPAKRPRSPAKRGRKKSSTTEDDAVDTGEPGKRVVIVGGGWAGKSGHSQTCVDMHLFSSVSHS